MTETEQRTSTDGQEGLATLQADGSAPRTRMSSAAAVQDLVSRFAQADDDRNKKRARVNGLIDGNPPYSAKRLRDEGRSDRANANWGTARSYVESAVGAFYDLATEAPGRFSAETDFGNDEQRPEWSRIICAEADAILNDGGEEDEAGMSDWDYELQLSQDEMVKHGCGPLFFEDAYSVLPRAVHCGDLKVPERTRASNKYWEIASVDLDYYPGELYEFIQDEEYAQRAGWNVEFTRQVIQNAMNVRDPNGRQYSWEWYQQELKNNSFSYNDETKVCRLAHVFWREFAQDGQRGKVTHAIVERNDTGKGGEYLFFHLGRFGSFRQCVHPFYCDRGNGGYHHSVTGLGVKMFSAMVFENRLLCNLMDGAFAPKMLFKPTSAQAKEKFTLAHHGNFGIVPSGYDAQQMPIQGLLSDGLAMFRTSNELMRSNLSSYRQQVAMEKPGNPATKYEKQMEASQQGSLSNTTFSRYYKQLDALYAEILRRLCDLNSIDPRARKFQERCEAQGAPRECFGRMRNVRAVRVIGQGSPFLRKQAVMELAPYVSGFPETGHANWLNDLIASSAGGAAVNRYNPPAHRSKLPTDQQADALQWIACMKVGVVPVATASQNPLTHAASYLNAAAQAAQSVQKGADPAGVVAFLDIVGPAIAAHLKRMENDPLRKQVVGALTEQWKKLASVTDGLKKMVRQKGEAMKKQAAKTGQVMSEAQLAQLKTMSDIGIKSAKAKAQMDLHKKKAAQSMALQDATTASQIHRQNRLAAFQE